MRRLILSLALLLLVPTSLSSQENPCLRRVLPVSVVGRDEVPVAGLTAENFRGSFRGAPVKIVSAKFDARPRRLVILLDLSGSMTLGSKLRVAQFIVAHALTSAPNGSQVALITVSEKAKIRTGLLQDKQAMADLVRDVNRLDRKSLKGRTALWDAVGAAVNLLNPPQQGDVVYAVTDGGDNASHLKKRDAAAALLESGLRLFALLVPENARWNFVPEEQSSPQELVELAEMTGGKVLGLPPMGRWRPANDFDLSPEEQKEISDAASLLYMRMQRFHLVEIELTIEVDKSRSWKLELVPTGGRQVKGLNLHYPTKLLPCTPAKDTPQAAAK